MCCYQNIVTFIMSAAHYRIPPGQTDQDNWLPPVKFVGSGCSTSFHGPRVRNMRPLFVQPEPVLARAHSREETRLDATVSKWSWYEEARSWIRFSTCCQISKIWRGNKVLSLRGNWIKGVGTVLKNVQKSDKAGNQECLYVWMFWTPFVFMSMLKSDIMSNA